MTEKPRTIEQLRDDAQRMTKLERAVYALDKVEQPAPAATVAKQTKSYQGLCSMAVARLLPRHPQVAREKVDGRYVYFFVEAEVRA